MLVLLVLFAAICLFLLLWPSVGKSPDAEERRALAQRSSHYVDGAFRNEHEVRTMTGERGH